MRIMRKHQQRQILELLQTIDQAQSMGLYADCQRGAQGAVEFIERIAGEGTQTVMRLVYTFQNFTKSRPVQSCTSETMKGGLVV
jgi:hypothetical protein